MHSEKWFLKNILQQSYENAQNLSWELWENTHLRWNDFGNLNVWNSMFCMVNVKCLNNLSRDAHVRLFWKIFHFTYNKILSNYLRQSLQQQTMQPQFFWKGPNQCLLYYLELDVFLGIFIKWNKCGKKPSNKQWYWCAYDTAMHVKKQRKRDGEQNKWPG